MASSYPGGIKSFSTKLPGQTVASAHIDDLQDEVVAMEAALINGFTHDLKPSVAGAEDLGASTLPWRLARVGGILLTDATELTIAAGVVTVTQGYHRIDTEADAASDDLDTLTPGTGLAAGSVIVVRAENVARVVTLKNGTGNLKLQGDYAMATAVHTLTLLYDGTNWREIARSVSPSSAVTLLHSGNGTSTAAGATTVDSFVLPALTANDRIVVEFYVGSAAQATANPQLYHVTDGAALVVFNGSPGAGVNLAGEAVIHRSQASATSLLNRVNGITSTGPAAIANYALYAATAAWSAGWTLGLRHTGVTAGGTFSWQWSVYLHAGQ